MAFRRFTRSRFSRSRSSFSRFRFRPMNAVRRPLRWSRGQVQLEAVHSHDEENRGILTVFPLAMVQNLVAPTAGADVAGELMAQAVRKLEIGGVKLTIHRRLMGFNRGQATGEELLDTNLWGVWTKHVLASDRLVTEPTTGSVTPQAIFTNWFTNTQPVATTPAIPDEDGMFPTRIHHQDFVALDSSIAAAGIEEVGGSETTEQILYVPSQQATNPSHTTYNKRLRLRLQDDECLCLHLASFTPTTAGATDNQPEVVWVVNGTIWYRYVW